MAVVAAATVTGASPVVTFPVQQIQPFFVAGASVYLVPEREYQRQFAPMTARLYGVDLLPSADPYRRALGSAIFRLAEGRRMTAQVWEEGTGRAVRLFATIDGRWTELNREIVREGAALPRKEGQVVPYRAEEVEARTMQVGRYAYRPLASFWANSTPLYARTLRPGPGVLIPFAVAMVNPTRIEAGYLGPKGVVLLPTSSTKLKYYLLKVEAKGPELRVVMRGIGESTPVAFVWRWDGSTYLFIQTTPQS
jgi:hypothetical protein